MGASSAHCSNCVYLVDRRCYVHLPTPDGTWCRYFERRDEDESALAVSFLDAQNKGWEGERRRA